ncbi:MAG: prolyl oligopeptidase family serine peptidase [Desulforhopalus sp.]
MKFSKPIPVTFVSFIGLLFIFGLWSKNDSEEEIQFVKEFTTFSQIAELPLRNLPKHEAWQEAAPGVIEIEIPRGQNEPGQPALWYHSGTESKKPLLLVLHSWSADYLQHYGIPYGVFAERNNWIFIHPNYRGKFDDPDATASEKAVQDVLDALAYAKANAPVDEDRIYLAGFSGGAMMSLIMAGRYPEKFSAALAWVPVYDLNDWYGTVIQSKYKYTEHYRNDIEASCGGNPHTDSEAKKVCRNRSPSAYLSNARGKNVQFFISGGIEDHFVPPSHAIRAFNDLAEAGDRISEADYQALDKTESLPENLAGQEKEIRFFEEADLPVVFARKSGNATLFLFDGGHDIVYNAGLQWLSQQQR